MSRSGEAFGTIAPLHGSCKIGLETNGQFLVRPIPKYAISKWTVQSVDHQKYYYRLFVSDGEKEYALRASDDATSITAVEASPTTSESHIWFIPHIQNKFFVILDPATIRAWKVNGTTIELVEPPNGEDGLDLFKFDFSFSG